MNMEILTIRKSLLAVMEEHAKKEAPFEACGLLAGREGIVEKFFPVPNKDASNEHFSIDISDQLKVIQAIRKLNMQLIGIWHSHPETPARMSEEDKKLAYTPDVYYVISSLNPIGDERINAFFPCNGEFKKVEIKII